MELRPEVTKMNGQKVKAEEIQIELLKDGSNDHKIKCLCMMCKSAYTERPLICRCASNVFLRDVENGELKE